MALSTRLEVRQNQSLVMTPQLQQSMKLLQMSNLQLADYVVGEVEKNPLLELVSAPRSQSGSSDRGSGGSASQVSPGNAWEAVAAAVTLQDHLRAQLIAGRSRGARVAMFLADELDDDGYLRSSLAELAGRYRVSRQDVDDGLVQLQSCDPAGVGARNLPECLELQLRERNRLDPAMATLLENLHLVAAEHWEELQVRCGVDAADISDMLAELRALDPKPGLRFEQAPVAIAVPDVHVHAAAAGGWTIELNTETLPRVLVNNVYRSSSRVRDVETRAFISECNARANWLVRSLAQRARTILRVASDIVTHQQLFFSLGIGRMRPLTQRAVAERLSLHESTVSRVAAGKYLSCDQGLFELRFFFSSAIPAAKGGEAFAGLAVQERVRRLIGAEPHAQVLSDDKIVSLLRAEGIDIARRTVAKYRDALGIPSSVQRRRSITAVSRR